MADKHGIGISQAIPMDMMVECIRNLLKNGTISRDNFAESLAQYPRGANRLKKMRQNAQKILFGTANDISALISLLSSENSTVLGLHEIKLIAIALCALTYPAFYQLLVMIARQFKVQTVVSRAFINQKMADLYGGNRTLAIGVDAIIPMLVESGLIQRRTTGLYEKGVDDSRVIGKSVCEYWVRVDLLLSGNKAFSADELIHHPWSDYCPGIEHVLVNPKLLKIETMVGSKAYITL